MKSKTAKPHATHRRQIVRNILPNIVYPQDLPVSQKVEDLRAMIDKHPVVIVCGATGSGKTTQLPKICLELGRGRNALIGHTQPRRLAAITVAQRIAVELKSECGHIVGYQVRFAQQMQEGAWVKLMTDGILLSQTQQDPDLLAYDTLIIDEAHERSLNIDFLLGYLKQLLARRPDLKVIITSATIDARSFSEHFASIHGPAPVVMVEGRTYPVEIRYTPPDEKLDWTQVLCDAVSDLEQETNAFGPQDMLVFLSGEREIKDAEQALRKHYHMALRKPEILPLYSRLSASEQQRVFTVNQSGVRRIVLTTNVAETSVTVPGIRYVIDTGTARVKRYSYRNKVEQLLVEPISQAAAQQRAGRCGRVAAGICVRLYDELDFSRRPPYTDPEILRSSLAAVILRMKSLRLMDIEHFPFIDAPSAKAIADGYTLLKELDAIDNTHALTTLGEQLALLPTDPKLGRMVLAGEQLGALNEVITIASALSIQDPRERPNDKSAQADQAHKVFADEKSEFISLLNLWAWYDKLRKNVSIRKTFDECRTHYLNGVRMREWADIHAQLTDMANALHLRHNTIAAPYPQLHQALLAGLLGNIGFKSDDDQLWSGCRGIKFLPHPGAHITKKPSKWLMAGSLTETTRLYARTVAAIDPVLIERAALHLIIKSYSDPAWSRKQAQTVAFERGTLYGLTIYHGRRVAYAPIDPALSREIMIRGALVEQDWDCQLPFFVHNAKLIKEIEKLEHQVRRPDLMVDDALLFAFYDNVIPQDVTNGAALERWLKTCSHSQMQALFLNKDDLLKRQASGITVDSYPKQLTFMGQAMRLEYRFEHGSPRDGVTLYVPLIALNQVDAVACEWLVPGMLKDKVQQLLKNLPPKIRHRCQPLSATSDNFVDWAVNLGLVGKQPLVESLLDFVRDLVGIPVRLDDFKTDLLPAHCLMNFQVQDEHGRMLDLSRQLPSLRAEFGVQAQAQFVQAARQSKVTVSSAPLTQSVEQPNPSLPNKAVQAAPEIDTTQLMTTWTLSDWPELLEIKRAGKVLVGFPALQAQDQGVRLEVFDDEQVAKSTHKQGLRKLVTLALKEPLKALDKTLKPLHTVAIQAQSCKIPVQSAEQLVQTVISAALDGIIDSFALPKTAQDFQEITQQCRAKVSLLAQEWAKRVQLIVSDAATAYKKIGQIKGHQLSHNHMLQQYERLLSSQFLQLSFERLGHYPRYLQGIALRCDKLRADPSRDEKLLNELKPLWVQYDRARTARKGQADEALDQIRWLLEELHIGLFAQELRTPTPVSVKRLLKAFEALER